MCTVLTVLIALLPTAQEDPSIAPGSSFQEFVSAILPYRDSALFEIPYRFLPIVANLQLTNRNEDNPRTDMLMEISAIDIDPETLPESGRMDWVDELALDWGTAEIGPGFLYPNDYFVSRPPGRWPRGGANGGRIGGLGGDLPPGVGPDIGGGPIASNPVPEPASVLAWTVVVIGGYCWRRKLLSQPRRMNSA